MTREDPGLVGITPGGAYAFMQGIRAHADGQAIGSCPYKSGTREALKWLQGFDDARTQSGKGHPAAERKP